MARREYPSHPRPSCHALVHREGRVLLIQRAAEPFKGYWGLPGGAVELGESVEDALTREVAEETGLEVSVERLLGYRDAILRDEAGQVRFHYVIFFFLAHPVRGRLRAATDAAGVAWVDLSSLPRYQLTDSVIECLRWAGLLQEGES